jgi:hypothetical protein
MEELQPEEIKDLLKELEEEYGGEEASRREARDDALQYLEEAFAARARDEFEAALAKCDMAIKSNPGLAEAHNLRGIVLEELGRKLEAVVAYREAARLDPGSAAARENLQELEAELKIQDWLRRYETEAAEGTQQQPSLLAPSEIILLHGDRFASTSSARLKLGEWVRLVHMDTDAEARELGRKMLAAAFLAVEQAGAVRLEVRRQQALFGLLEVDKLYVVPGERAISWPSRSFESELGKGSNSVSEIIYDWWMRREGRKSSSPWATLGRLVKDGLAYRGLLEKERKSGLKGFLAGESYVLPAEAAAMATQQSLEPIRQLLATCRRTRPEVWDLLMKGINKGIGKSQETPDWD